MKSTESSKRRQKAVSPPAKDTRALRILRELQIDGNEALRSGSIERRSSTVRKFGGASYEVEADGFSWARSKTQKGAASAAAASPSASRRRGTRNPEQAPAKSSFSAGPSKKRKRAESAVAGDDDFLAETIRQLKRVKVPKSTSRQAEIHMMLPFLQKLKAPCRQRTRQHGPMDGQRDGEASEAYELDALEARRFLRSENRVEAPVFFDSGAMAIIDEENETRPIEQFLDWLPDPAESYSTYDLEKSQQDVDVPTKLVTIAEIRERFINQQGYQQYPWNFPEIPCPATTDMPELFRLPKCNLLNDICRYMQNIENEDICPETCPKHGTTARKCGKHLVTAQEIVEFGQGYRHWLRTMMLAEAGALTPPHFDGLGFGTLIDCHEGEIGFAWLIANEEERVARQGEIEPSNRWRFKVLRQGNSVYMPPGTRHLVFRLPEGKQTLASSVRVVRYCDIVEWLQVLHMEAQHAFDDRNDGVEFVRITRGLVMGARHWIGQAKAHKRLEKFGSPGQIKNAEKLLGKLKKQLQF